MPEQLGDEFVGGLIGALNIGEFFEDEGAASHRAMDAVDLILKALSAAGAAGVTEVGKRTAGVLMDLLARKFKGRRDAEVALKEYPQNPGVWEKPLRHVLVETAADSDDDVLKAATLLVSMMQTTQSASGQQVIQAGGDVQAMQVGHLEVTVHPERPQRPGDLGVTMERFKQQIAPDQRRRGYKTALVRQDDVDDKRFDGWEEIVIPDPGSGEPGRVVILHMGHPDVVGMRRRLVSYRLSDLAKRLLVAAYQSPDRGAINKAEYDQPPYARIVAGVFEEDSFEDNQALNDLIDGGFARHVRGVRYELTGNGLDAAKELLE